MEITGRERNAPHATVPAAELTITRAGPAPGADSPARMTPFPSGAPTPSIQRNRIVSIFERKQRLIKTRLQMKIILTFVGLAIVATVFQVVLVNKSMTAIAQRMPQEGDLLLSELPGVIRSTAMLGIAFLVPFMIGVGLVLTNRIAGPIYRFEQYLTQVATGQHDGPVTIRKGDELQELAERINLAVRALEQGEKVPERQRLGKQKKSAA